MTLGPLEKFVGTIRRWQLTGVAEKCVPETNVPCTKHLLKMRNYTYFGAFVAISRLFLYFCVQGDLCTEGAYEEVSSIHLRHMIYTGYCFVEHSVVVLPTGKCNGCVFVV